MLNVKGCSQAVRATEAEKEVPHADWGGQINWRYGHLGEDTSRNERRNKGLLNRRGLKGTQCEQSHGGRNESDVAGDGEVVIGG